MQSYSCVADTRAACCCCCCCSSDQWDDNGRRSVLLFCGEELVMQARCNKLILWLQLRALSLWLKAYLQRYNDQQRRNKLNSLQTVLQAGSNENKKKQKKKCRSTELRRYQVAVLRNRELVVVDDGFMAPSVTPCFCSCEVTLIQTRNQISLFVWYIICSYSILHRITRAFECRV